MTGKKPDFKVQIVSKKSKEKIDLVLGWVNENDQIGGVICKEVDSIKLEDGRTIRGDNVWVNIYDNREDEPQQKTHIPGSIPGVQHRVPNDVDDDPVPF